MTLLKKMAEKGERATRSGGDRSCIMQLQDLGIEKTQAHRWQKEAEVPGTVAMA